MKSLITSGIFAALLAIPVTADDNGDKEFTIREWPVRYAKEKPPKGGPVERLFEILDLIKSRKFSEAKEKYFSKKMPKEYQEYWSGFNILEKTRYQLKERSMWGVYEVDKDGNPRATVVYINKANTQMTFSCWMVKEDGTWKLIGRP